MTSYFDDAVRDAHNAIRQFDGTSGEDDLEALAEVEARVIADVNLVTGDREFPDSLREEIQGAIATHRVRSPDGIPTKGDEYARMVSRSSLIDRLHTLFHEVASQRIQTRFGLLSDNPKVNLALRDDHDGE